MQPNVVLNMKDVKCCIKYEGCINCCIKNVVLNMKDVKEILFRLSNEVRSSLFPTLFEKSEGLIIK